jgi:integrase
MASYRKRGKVWYYRFVDADGVKREEKGCTDRRATEELARHRESEAAKIRAGILDPRELAFRNHAASPLEEHIVQYRASLFARGNKPKHARQMAEYARRVVALAKVGRLSDLAPGRVQDALKALRDEGLSLETVNRHRTAIRAFSRWCWKDGRTRTDLLVSVTGFNAKEDRRHDRRTLGVDELRRLIDAAHNGPRWVKMSGPARALCYRLAVGTGLRYSEIMSITPESFDWMTSPAAVRVAAGYTKNGEPATLPLPSDLADDLAPYVATIAPGEPIFPLTGQGSQDAQSRPRTSGHPIPRCWRLGLRFPRLALPVCDPGRSGWRDAKGRPEAHEAFDPRTDRPLYPPPRRRSEPGNRIAPLAPTRPRPLECIHSGRDRHGGQFCPPTAVQR